MIRLTTLAALLAVPTLASAIELAMPEGSVLASDDVVEEGSYALPDGPYIDDFLSSRQVTGHLSKQVWHLPGRSFTTEQLIAPIRSQLEAAGFAILLDCDAQSCGGFDFRFATEVLPAPDMFVDLVNYRFISALKDSPDGIEALSAFVSLSDVQGFTQLIAVQPGPASEDLVLSKPSDALPKTPKVADLAVPSDVIKTLEVGGHVVLSDLEFETGSANLTTGEYASLKAIADYLRAKPSTKIALVGHTDNVGSLEGNVALSQKRAGAVKTRLIEDYGISADQIDSQGVGYLAPIASNQSDAGRTANRRVEAVLLAN